MSSLPKGGEAVIERTATFTPGEDKSEAFPRQVGPIREKDTLTSEQRSKRDSRAKALLTGKDLKEHFDVVSNRETLEAYTNTDGPAPKPFEELTDSERTAFLKDGVLLPTKEKPADAKQDAKTDEKDAKRDGAKQSGTEEYDPEHDPYILDPKWTKEAHEQRFQEFTGKTLKQLEGEKDARGQNVLERIQMPERLKDSPELLKSFLGIVANTRHPDAVMRALADDPELLKDERYWTSQRGFNRLLDDLIALDRKVGRGARRANGNGNGAGRTEPRREKEITQAGKPPREIGGTSSSPGDQAQAALQRGDGDEYRRIENEREAVKWRAKHKGRRR
jgi:hypothetical protein